MTELKEVPTEELLSFHDFPTTHSSTSGLDPFAGAEIKVDVPPSTATTTSIKFEDYTGGDGDVPKLDDTDLGGTNKSLWSIEYFQKYFDVDTKDVVSRIIGSMFPMRNRSLRAEIKTKPDLYGPFWISITLVFTIAISGNIANYLQHANPHYHWKYDFHLVSYTATAIFLYITLVPLGIWGLIKWSSPGEVDEYSEPRPKALELICIYGYSLFVYIPSSILWTIQVEWLQWILVLIAAFLSGTVLLLSLLSSLNASRHKIVLSLGILCLHLLLAAGFMLYFFHVPPATFVRTLHVINNNSNSTHKP